MNKEIMISIHMAAANYTRRRCDPESYTVSSQFTPSGGLVLPPTNGIFVLAQSGLSRTAILMRVWGLSFNLATAASILVLGCMVHFGIFVAGHIQETVITQAASEPALYISNFVAPYIQDLETNENLSKENRKALERLLAPGSMLRPVIAFRVWKGNKIVFSNEGELIGKTFTMSPSRERAWEGQIAVEFNRPDGDDDEQVRSLKVPILEVYSPLRKTGSDRIIALVETYEIALDLDKKLSANRLLIWTAIGAVTCGIILLLFSMAGTGRIEQAWLRGQVAESERRRKQMSKANLKLSETSERALAQIETALHRGPTQHVTLALLKLGSMADLVSGLDDQLSTDKKEYEKDLATIRQALTDTLNQIRGFASQRLPMNIADLTPTQVIESACRRHEGKSRQPVTFKHSGLPKRCSFSTRASLYRIALDGLNCVSRGVRTAALVLRASTEGDHVRLEFAGEGSEEHPEIDALRNRVEAAGGELWVRSSRGRLFLDAQFVISDLEQIDA